MKLQLVDASYNGVVEVSVSVQTASVDVAATLDSGLHQNNGLSVRTLYNLVTIHWLPEPA
jgi:hypothetical protein